MLTVLAVGDQLVLGVEENGIASCEALLLARHFMHQRVYQYSSVQGCKFHLRRFMKEFYAAGEYLSDLSGYLSIADSEILAALRKAAREGHLDAAALLKNKGGKFRAIELQRGSDAGMLQRLKEELKIPEAELSWSLSNQLEGEFSRLTFPVLCKGGEVIPAETLSQLQIPKLSFSWAFVAPSFEKPLRAALKEREVVWV